MLTLTVIEAHDTMSLEDIVVFNLIGIGKNIGIAPVFRHGQQVRTALVVAHKRHTFALDPLRSTFLQS
jgi:hypothetical protein